MNKVAFGNRGEHVSEICLGCMYFGSKSNKEDSYRLLDIYYEAGGRFLDTANNYAFWIDGFKGGESETVLGTWMEERKNRDEIFLATKCGANPRRAGDGLDNIEGLSAAAVEKAVEGSLRRLRTDRIDLYYAHIDDKATPMEETLAALNKLVQTGKVRYIACSNLRPWKFALARRSSQEKGWAGYSCIQQQYTYLRPQPGSIFVEGLCLNVDEGLLEYCAQYNIPILAYSPLLRGAYSREDRALPLEYLGPDTDARLKALKEVSRQSAITVNQLVLAWMLHSNPRIIPLVAASTEEQLRENLLATEVTLSTEQMEYLNRARGF